MKNWGPLTIALIAVVVSVYAVYLDNAHFDKALKQDQIREQKTDVQFGRAMSKAEEANDLAGKATELAGEANKLTGEANDLAKEALAADQQHAEHAELSNHLSMLHIRLNDQLQWLNEIPDAAGAAREAGRPFHVEATNNWGEAGKELLSGNFDWVRELIEIAHDNIGKCYSAAEEESGRQPLPPTLPPRPVWIGEEEETY